MLGRWRDKTDKPQVQPVLDLAEYLAKTYTLQQGTILPGRTVAEHCQIVGEVARALLLRLPKWLRDDLFPEGSELIAASHDIGKISPTFQKKISDAILHQKKVYSEIESKWGGHAGVSQLTAEAHNTGAYIPTILGQHHGYSPNLANYQSTSSPLGGQNWHLKRSELLAHLKQVMGTDFPDIKDPLQALVLSGLTTVSDWIGSGFLFDDPQQDWRPKIEQALDLAGFIRPKIKKALGFSDIFPFSPNQIQIRLIESAKQPGVYVLEAPMGMGKTEAALFAAYLLLQNDMASGIYFALPTQLTSDKIYARVNDFLTRVLDDQSPHKQALLVHGSAWLTHFDMGKEADPGRSWFAQGKRGILAPFAVGTIDQALMAVMNIKHGFVRTFGLAGKVVILDEVHSYDSFTGTILDDLVKALRKLNCTVIILSATLTQDRRAKLLGTSLKSNRYPLITSQPNKGKLREVKVEKIKDVPVAVGHHSEIEAIEEALLRAENGEQVLWIENTVREAQGIYHSIAARAKEMDISCGLLHSRFTKKDRASNEEIWVDHFGKSGSKTRQQQGRILVGTQVLEQSLDIDADFLVTRISPTDMLLQRIGRLWRHSDTCRPRTAKREVWLIAPKLDIAIDAPEEAFGATAKVYEPYILCRSLEVWQDVTRIKLPGQIRGLIEDTYRQKVNESEAMQKHLQQGEKKKNTLERLALHGLSSVGSAPSDENAQTRYSDQISVEVLLIRACQQDQQKKGTWVTLLNGEKLWVPFDGRSLPRNEWRKVTATLIQSTVKAANYLAPKAVSKKEIDWLEDYFYLGRGKDDEIASLRVALVAESGLLKTFDNSVINDTYRLTYDATLGYQAIKR